MLNVNSYSHMESEKVDYSGLSKIMKPRLKFESMV